jgi:hypothetical protein
MVFAKSCHLANLTAIVQGHKHASMASVLRCQDSHSGVVVILPVLLMQIVIDQTIASPFVEARLAVAKPIVIVHLRRVVTVVASVLKHNMHAIPQRESAFRIDLDSKIAFVRKTRANARRVRLHVRSIVIVHRDYLVCKAGVLHQQHQRTAAPSLVALLGTFVPMPLGNLVRVVACLPVRPMVIAVRLIARSQTATAF